MSPPRIDNYRFGRVVIDGQAYTKDVIILPDRVVDGWWRREGHRLHPDDLETVFDACPQVLVVGEGAYGRLRVPSETRQALQAAGIRLISERTRDACRAYNELCSEQPAAAALHLTC
jgi:hypothetical protein